MRFRIACLFVVTLAATAAGVRAEEEKTMLDRIPAGEYWYAMLGKGPQPMGYAHLRIERIAEGGLAVEWELKLAHESGNYEETRVMSVDSDAELLFSEYRVYGNLVCSGKRSGDEWVVTTLKDGKPEVESREAPKGAMTGMGFVFASAVPREEGGSLSRLELDEANAFDAIGETKFTWKRQFERDWEGEKIVVHEILMEKGNERTMPIEIADDGRLIQSDWGGGNLMVLSKESTKDLYRPAPPAISVVDSPPDRLVMRGELPKLSPEEVYDHYTQPELLTKFWAPEAEIEAKPGGKYHLHWPGPGWRLVGTVKEAECGKKLSFTWNWAHTPDAPELVVTMTFEPREGGGTVVTLEQGPYRDTEEDRKEREGHAQGWQFFFAKLRAL